MAEKKSTALTVVQGFQIAKPYEGIDPDTLAELQDELDDLDPESGITCRKIKIPSGGGIAYEVQGEDDDDTDAMKEIKAVIVFTHRVNAYWPGAYGDGDQNQPPLCSSMDGKTGVRTENGEVMDCERCPFNQYGTAGENKRGKACKNMRRLYLMMNGDPNFYLLTVPPTSIREVNKQLTKILGGGTPYIGMVVSFTLKKDKNEAGIAYSKVVLQKAGVLPAEVAQAAKAMRHQIKEQYKNVAITLNDYATVDDSASLGSGRAVDIDAGDWTDDGTLGSGAAFEEAPPHGDNDAPLPFA